MAKRPSGNGVRWSAKELKLLKKLAKQGTVAQAAKVLGRSASAVQQRSSQSAISFR